MYLHSGRTGHQPTRKLRAETCANLHLTIPAHKTHCRSGPREPRNYKGDCAYANGFTFLVEGIDAVIRRTPVRNAVVSVWCPDRLWRPAIEWGLFVRGKMGRAVNLTSHLRQLPTLMNTCSFSFPFPYIFMST